MRAIHVPATAIGTWIPAKPRTAFGAGIPHLLDEPRARSSGSQCSPTGDFDANQCAALRAAAANLGPFSSYATAQGLMTRGALDYIDLREPRVSLPAAPPACSATPRQFPT
jgi:hypothetical protein